MLTPCLASTIRIDGGGFRLWIWLVVIGRSRCRQKPGARLPLPFIRDSFSSRFELCNAPATFEWLMDQVLQGLRWSRCLVYLDDIISFGTTFEDALDNLTLIFERLRTYGLQLKSTKCHLFQTSVPFLGRRAVQGPYFSLWAVYSRGLPTGGHSCGSGGSAV